MFPLLATIGDIPIHSYGVLIAIGFLCGIYTMRTLAIKDGLPADRVLDLAFWGLIAGLVGSRILFVVTRWEYFSQDPLAMFRIWQGGLVFLGAPFTIIPLMVWYLRKYQIPMWETMDIMITGSVLGHAFGRLGCLAAGCCYGKPTGTDFGIQLFSSVVAPTHRGINLHPTQIYESSALFLLFVGMLWIHRNRKFPGQVFISYFLIYPIIRSIIEIYRGDLIRGFVVEGWISTSQFISAILFVVAAFVMHRKLKELKG